MNHRGDETHTNVVKFPLWSWGVVFLIQLSAHANLSEFIVFSLEFLSIEVSLVWHTPFLKRNFTCPTSDSSNAMIDREILFLGTVT